jgi:hypothetical protein
MPAAQGQNVVVAYKAQGALGTPASGAGATGIEVRPSAGLSLAVATIESQMFRKSLMKMRPRQGSYTLTGKYETELQVGNCDGIFAGVMGGAATATFQILPADVTSIAIVGATGVVTGASGSFITKGLRAGMMVKFGLLTTSSDNSVWVPVLSVTASTFTVPANLLADCAADTTFTIDVAKSYSTPTPYVGTYYTFEEYLAELDASKVGADCRFTGLNFACAPNTPTVVGFDIAGRSITAPTGASAPTFTSPVFNAQVSPSSLVMLDGALYRNGVAALDLTGFTCGISAPATQPPLLVSRTAIDVFMGMFAFNGQFTGFIQDTTAFASFLAEDRISIFARFSENESDPKDFVSIYIGDASYGGWNAPISEGGMIQTIPLYAGADMRGTGFNATTMLISTSAA